MHTAEGNTAVLAGGFTELKGMQATDPFEQLFIAEYARVVGIAARVLGDAGEAEDVAQEVFVALHRRHLQGTPFAAGWLHSAAVHTALNVVRSRRRRSQREAREAAAAERIHGNTQASLDPQQALESGERRLEVRAALARLPARGAAVLVLRYSGLSYTEVAEALGVGINQVGTLLRRAEAALRKEMSRATPQ